MNFSSIIKEIRDFVLRDKIVSISGEAGTGKTTLALQLVTSLVLDEIPYHHQCLWIQASERFPKKRLETMLHGKREELLYLQSNIFLIPETIIKSYYEQFSQLNHFELKNLPPDIKVIVIDNISHHLRYEISQKEEIVLVNSIKNAFYDQLLFPLIMYCQRDNIVLLLLHEVSSDVKSGTTKPFFSSLYNRIKGASITLHRQLISRELIMKFSSNKVHNQMKYQIRDEGLVIP